MIGRDQLKRQAAERAVELVEDGMVLGLGTGSTARHVLDVLAERLEAGSLRGIVGVPTSRATEWYAREVGIRLTTLEDEPRLDLTIDGADEVGSGLDLIKGLGGALLWEKIVASASERLVIVADQSKRVDRLGAKAPLPIEVVPFGWTTHLSFLDTLGCEPTLRRTANGSPFTTDSGNYLLDCRFDAGISDPVEAHRAAKARVGIVETGLFLGMAEAVFVATGNGVDVLRR